MLAEAGADPPGKGVSMNQEMAPEMATLKARLKATWMAGDYGTFAKYLEPGALEFLERLRVEPGTRLLDVACGAGQISVPAARAGAHVTGVDTATNSIEQARARAQDEGLDARFEEGDAEMLPYEDASFDVVASLFGAMFAPRPERVAAELVRVCRPGGRIVMGNWTPEGFVGQLFKVIGRQEWMPKSVGRIYTMMDNLRAHKAYDVLLFNVAHPRWEFVFQPKYAAYLNLIEPWWKTLRSLALAGRFFQTWDEIEEAISRAVDYWNAHRHPYFWGRRRRRRAARKTGRGRTAGRRRHAGPVLAELGREAVDLLYLA